MSDGALGILAGRGELPWMVAENAIRAGEEVHIFPFTEDPIPSHLQSHCTPVVLTRMYASVFASLKKKQVRRLISIGKASKDILYKNPRFDARTLLLLARMENLNDYTIFKHIARELDKIGITVLDQTTYLGDCFLEEGRYGKKLKDKQIEDVSYGMMYAREMNRLDIGQTVVVGQRSVIAVECVEGTDQCIRRGGALYARGGAVVCKVAKRNHDRRFDIPVTGESTLRSMQESRCHVLAIEAGATIVVNKSEFLKSAKQKGITVISLHESEQGFTDMKKLRKLNRSGA
ncbi:MAG: UDP-2,3-diacylglucosamine diphosphatase LpxI [Leptospiraceae bacterium]|nr:UDP-2,3-diacylglucosamine diphosphatase LpxI [Leptospiraceae bacterium]